MYDALAHPARRRILAQLGPGAATVSQLAEPFAMSLPAVSKHIRALEQAKLVRRTVDGREHWIALNPQPLRAAAEWLEGYRGFWEAGLDRLEAKLLERRGR